MEPVDRRDFIKTVAGTAAFTALEGKAAMPANPGPVFLSTWIWGKSANEHAAEVFKSGGSLLDAVEKGINMPESDPNVMSVGYGGIPNAEGVVELDAAIMDGARHRAGSVCNLHMIKNPISVARLVMEKTRHTTLAGEGAFRFALKMGFEPQTLLTPQSLQKWQEWNADPHHKTFWLTPETTTPSAWWRRMEKDTSLPAARPPAWHLNSQAAWGIHRSWAAEFTLTTTWEQPPPPETAT